MISSPPGEGKHAALSASVLPFPLAGDQQAMLVIYPQIRLQFFGSTSLRSSIHKYYRSVLWLLDCLAEIKSRPKRTFVKELAAKCVFLRPGQLNQHRNPAFHPVGCEEPPNGSHQPMRSLIKRLVIEYFVNEFLWYFASI